jgi:ADP-ribosylglycohydrolase
MTLFTAEGVIRAQVRFAGRGICHPPSVIHHALLRWLYTQGERSPALPEKIDGWLIQQQPLFARRAPGNTCLSALRASARFGDQARNDSKGCGALMRIAPIGLFADTAKVFQLATESARSTHGHRESTLSSGFFALLIAYLMKGEPLAAAIAAALPTLQRQDEHEVVLSGIEQAQRLVASSEPATPELIETLGGGWVAEEALAISLYCSLRAESFEHGVRLAANHSGDSDSTASLAGQLLGTLRGPKVIPPHWVEPLELRNVIETMAADLVTALDDVTNLEQRYPGW